MRNIDKHLTLAPAPSASRSVVGAILTLALILPALLGGCGESVPPPASLSPTAPAPTATAKRAERPSAPAYWPTTGWRTSTPEEQGVDSLQLLRTLQRIDEAGINVRSLTVIRHGYIVLEAYSQPFTPDQLYTVASVTKSVIGNLMGIALAEGKIKDVEQPVLGFFPERTIANRDAAKESLTLADLLSMQPGLDCGDDRLAGKVEASPDWVQTTLDLPMANPPGKTLVYCTAGVHLLSAILTKATGMGTAAYAQSHLFTPLGIAPGDYTWGADPQGITIGGYGIQMKPRDMAKLGLLYLYNGRWDGRQVIPADWMAAATRAHAVGADGKDYGYLFWIYPSHFAAEGLGEQKIMVVPDRDMVVVFTAAIDWHKGAVLEPLLRDYLIPAAKTDGPLPANPTALAALQAGVQTLANPVQPVPALPVTARQISGKPFVLEDNALGLQMITLNFTEGSAEAHAIARNAGGADQLTIGLDNVYRGNRSADGTTVALRGHWENDGVFVVHALVLGDLREVEYQLDYSGDTLNGHIAETVFGEFSVDVKEAR